MSVQTVRVSALGASVGYRRAESNPDLPTVILLHSFSTNTTLFNLQFDDANVAKTCNLVAMDLFGHGATMGLKDSITYFDQAQMILEAMEKLSIEKAYILGTSQGGFVAARMYLLDSSKILGLILCGTSLYSETNTLGSWDINAVLTSDIIGYLSTPADDEWTLPQGFTDDVISSGLGTQATDQQKIDFRTNHLAVYSKDEGRARYLMIVNALKDRENLDSERLASIKCPILILHGTSDIVYSVALMQKWAAELTGAKSLKIEVIQDGTHFLTANKSELVNQFLVEFITSNK